MASTASTVDGWAVLARVVTPHRHTVTKYRAAATGLTVLHVDVPGTRVARTTTRARTLERQFSDLSATFERTRTYWDRGGGQVKTRA